MISDIRNLYDSCKENEYSTTDILSELKAKLKLLGGWPVVEGDKWNGKDFKWWELVKKGTDFGFLDGGFINVGK